jgi:hypothetical protein
MVRGFAFQAVRCRPFYLNDLIPNEARDLARTISTGAPVLRAGSFGLRSVSELLFALH